MFKNLYEGLSDLLYPPNCLSCKRYSPFSKKHEVLCSSCQSEIELNKPPFCAKCSRHLTKPKGHICIECRTRKYDFDQAWGVCLYNDLMRRLIYQFKYGGKTSLRHTFAGLLSQFIKSDSLALNAFDVVVPIPLHSTRLRERGFNQAELLSDQLTQSFGLKGSVENLIRVRPTENQAAIGKKDRWTNIQGAFKIKRPSEFFQKSVLIVDDLLTTGTTASEAARILKQAGADKVSVMTLAIVP